MYDREPLGRARMEGHHGEIARRSANARQGQEGWASGHGSAGSYGMHDTESRGVAPAGPRAAAPMHESITHRASRCAQASRPGAAGLWSCPVAGKDGGGGAMDLLSIVMILAAVCLVPSIAVVIALAPRRLSGWNE